MLQAFAEKFRRCVRALVLPVLVLAVISAVPTAAFSQNTPRAAELPADASGPSAPAIGSGFFARMTAGEKDALRLGIKQHFLYNGNRSDRSLQVIILIRLGRDAKIIGQPELLKASGGDEVTRQALFQAGRRALLRAQSAGEFMKLPPKKYDGWQEIAIVFSPEEIGFSTMPRIASQSSDTEASSIPAEAEDGWFDAVLIEAARSGDTAEVERLLASGADVNFQNYRGTTALIFASARGDGPIIDALLAKGAAVDLQTRAGVTALMVAAERGHAEIVKALLARGAAVDLHSKTGVTALFIASQEGHGAIVDALLAKGAAVDLQTEVGDTALMAAAVRGRAEIVQALLASAATVHLKRNDGHSALMLASNNGHGAIVKALLARGTAVDVQIHWGPCRLRRRAFGENREAYSG